MPELVKHPRYKVGDQVRLKFGTRLVGTVAEAHGSYSPDGHVFYDVYVPMTPEPLMMPLLEDEIEKT